MRRKSSMQRLQMTVYMPARRRQSGYVAAWRDPDPGARVKKPQKTLGTRDRREAYRLAGELADQVVQGIHVDGVRWTDFCARYELDCLASGRWTTDSDGRCASLEAWHTVLRYIRDLAPLANVLDATELWADRWQRALQQADKSRNTMATYCARLKAALAWAERKRLIDRAPYIGVHWEDVAPSRAPTLEEVDRILEAVPKVRPRDAPCWDRLLRGLAWCNLRIGELVRLSWDLDREIHIEHVRGYPLIHLSPKSHKGRRDRWQVVLREFWEVCAETPESERAGLVFPLPSRAGGNLTRTTVIRVISRIGRETTVLTKPETGKLATSHDIGRRAWLPKIDDRLTVAEAHKAMGHSSFQTTVDHYDTRTAAEIAAKLWGAESRTPTGASTGAAQSPPESGD